MKKRMMALLCVFLASVVAFGFDAAECGFSPEATGTENAAALQRAFDRGGTVTVMKPGRYKIAGTVFIGDNTSLVCGNGVVFVKTNEGKDFSHIILNKGALTKTWNKNICITGLEISVNGMDHLDWQVYGLAGQIAFFYVKDLRINRFRCYDLASEQYCIHICAFEDVVVDDVIIHGKKDGVHLGRGKRFTIRNGVFYTGDDPIALNAHDYSIGNPELGWIENGVIENCHDLGNCNNTRIGFFCRILAGAWVDWFEGMSVQESDTVVSNGSLYRVAVGPNGKNYVSKTRPTHKKGRQTYDEGIVWAHVQDEVVYNCGVRNVVFRDCFLYQPRTAAFSVHFDIGEWSRSYYPNAPIPVQEGITFENVQVLYDDPSPFINTVTPVDSMTLINCRLNRSNIVFDGNSPVKDYGVTKLQLIGCRFSASNNWTLIENTVPHKRVKLVTVGSMKDHDDLTINISNVGQIDVKSDVINANDVNKTPGRDEPAVKVVECPKCPMRMKFAADGKSATINKCRLTDDNPDAAELDRRLAALTVRAKKLLVKDDPNKGALTRPLMGWSSWNTFRVNISPEIILSVARVMATNGLKAAGYTYINTDDGFFGGRDKDGKLLFHKERFPNGLKGMVDEIHALGFKAGIYSEAGADTCGSMWDNDKAGLGSGLYGHDAEDFKLFFNDLGFDFIKIDYCGGQKLKLDERARYTEIAQALKATGRTDVRLNICRWAFPGTWAADFAGSWRTTGDICAKWDSLQYVIRKNLYLGAYASPGHYNDMDMMIVGRLKGEGFQSVHPGEVGLTPEEERLHFGLWCMMSSPLLIGCDPRTMPRSSFDLLTNPYLLAMNQNDLGLHPYVASCEGTNVYVLVKDAERRFGTARYVTLLNLDERPRKITVRARDLDLAGRIDVLDLMERADPGCFAEQTIVEVPAHGAKFYRFDAEKRLDRVVYEAESAFLTDFRDLGEENRVGVFPCATASGGCVVRHLGGSETNDLIWKVVKVSRTGDYELALDYAPPRENRFAFLQIDGGEKIRFETKAGTTRVVLPVKLAAGIHAVRLSNPTAETADFDRLTVSPLDFTNPVIAADWPDPAFWRANGRFYSVATQLRTIRSSENGIDWTDTGIDPLTPAARAKLHAISRNLWAPCVVKIGARWVLYISLFITNEDCRIEALTSTSPTGPFEYAGEVVNSSALKIMNTIDPYVLKADGELWMFFGSCQDGIHRVRLTPDGLSVKPGDKPVHVAGRRNPGNPYAANGKSVNIWCKPGTWEGAFLLKRRGWWYFFFSGGKYDDATYHLMVGRSRTIDGVFVNREGVPLTEAKAKPILFSDFGDKFYGPGHNGEVLTSEDGRDYMFYHCHDTAFPNEARPTFLQELVWDADGWPTFEKNRPKLRERRFKAATLSNDPCLKSEPRADVVVSGKTGRDIQEAIDRVAAQGGGRVVVPAGEWISGTIEMRSHVELHLEKGAVLKGSLHQKDYNKDDVFPENVAITGEGVIDGGAKGRITVEDCRPRPLRSAGILLLAFDDRNFADWERAIPLFEKYGARASFFVSGEFDKPAVQTAKKLLAKGHTIGLHGQRHLNVPEAIATFGKDGWWEKEIATPRSQADVAYIPVRSFAYPNNRNDAASDEFLLTRFERLRTGVPGVRPYDPQGKRAKDLKPLATDERLFFPAIDLPKRRVLGGVILGDAYNIDLDDVLASIRRAGERKEVLLFTSHGIHPNAKHIHLKTEWLERILAEAKKCGVEVLGFDDLP